MPRRRFVILLIAFVAVTAASLLLGRYPDPVVSAPWTILDDDLAVSLVIDLRLPRILMALLLGTVLAAAGFVFQSLFRNPLVDSGFLGVSQGAAFGASLAIIFAAGSPIMIQLGAASFAFLGLALSYSLARRIRFGSPILRLLLAGIAIGSFYTAGTGVLKYLADPQKELPDITFWMLGGLWAITWPDLLQILPVSILALLAMGAMRWRLNLLSLREETAFSLGASPRVERLVLLTAAVAATAAVVAKAGQITWVGLVIPHIARWLVGSNAEHALPAALVLGGLFVLLCDNLARTVLTGEIPLGILTALFGTVAFLLLMTGRRFGPRS